MPPVLHELEAEVMRELWERGPATVRDVLAALNARSARERAYTTVMTTMSRLSDKGLLVRSRAGKADVYEATMSRDVYAQLRAAAEVEALVDEFGDVALVHFVKAVGRLDPERRRELRRLARRA
jgi:predicted transcriptional regulator